jgi:O-antigen/teichoic acid export membrane protein
MTALRKFVGDVGIYAAGRMLGAVITVALVPFLTHTFSVEAYGALELSLVCAAVVGVIFSSGLPGAYAYFVRSEKYSGSRDVLIGAIAMWYLVWGFGLLVLVWLILPVVFEHSAGRALSRGELGCFYLFLALQQLFNFIVTVLRMDERAWAVVGLSVAASAFGGVATVALVLWDEASVLNYLLGFVLGFGSTVLAGGAMIRRDLAPRFALAQEWRTLLAFGVPLVPGALLEMALTVADRGIVTAYLGARELGIYALAGKIAGLVQLGIQAVTMALLPWCMKLVHQNDAGETGRRLGTMWRYVSLMFLAAALLGALLVPWLVELAAPPEYEGAGAITPYLMLAHVFHSFTFFTYLGTLRVQKTYLYTISVGLGVGASIGLSLWLTPIYGLAGAAWATLAGTVVTPVASLLFSQRQWPLDLPLMRIGAMSLTAAVAIGLIASPLMAGFGAIPSAGIVAAAIALLLVLGVQESDLVLLKRR